MNPAEIYADFFIWLAKASKRDSEDIHTYQLSTDDCRKLLDFLIENCR